MDVDRANFPKIFGFIEEQRLVERSECISFDLEFTGLRFDNNEKERFEDYLYERYEKMRNVVRKYSIIQVGLTFFVREGNGVTAFPFNFYVYPRAYRNINPQVCMQSSTIEFNTKNGMDWNRWIRDGNNIGELGITYVPMDRIADALTVPEKQSTYEELESKLNEEQAAELLLARNKLQKFMEDATRQEDEIEVSSTFVRLVIERMLEKDFANIYLEPFSCDSALKEKLLLSFRKVNSKDREEIRRMINLNIVGFTALFEKLWKRPDLTVVGHNSFFDLMYLMNSFVSELPVSYIKFKEEASVGFPKFYDTKYLSSRREFDGLFEGGTSLEELQKVILGERFSTIGKLVEVRLDEKFRDYDWNNPANKARLHEAGYDSYLTGWAYYQLAQRLKDIKQHEAKLPVIRSVWDLNLKTTADDFNEEGLVLVVQINKPKEYCLSLFEYKRKKIYETVELLNTTFGRGHYSKDDVKLREYRVDFVFISLINSKKRKEFMEDILQLQDKGLIDVRTMGTFVRERFEQFDPNKR